MPTESLNGIKIFYERQGVGPPIVLVHGSWGDHHNWDAVAPALAREYGVIRYDRRGHSQSGPAPTPGAAEQDVDDLLALWIGSRSASRWQLAIRSVGPSR